MTTELDRSPVPDYATRALLNDKIAIVVGAGQGIGRQIAHALAQFGANIVCVDNLEERAAQVATEVGGVAHTADVLRRDNVEALCADVVEEFGRIDIVVDIVGRAGFKSLVEATDQDWSDQIDMNLRHAWLLLQLAAPHMPAGGSFTFITSVAGITGHQGNAPYSAMKAALISLVRTASVELAPDGIRVNGVAPSVVTTPRVAAMFDEERSERFTSVVPLGRLSVPSDVAAAVPFLSSDLASYISGQNLVLDGAVSARMPYPDFQ